MVNFNKMYWNDTSTMTRLSAIRAKYDPTGGFDSPGYIQRGIDFGGSDKTCEKNDPMTDDNYPPKDNNDEPTVVANTKNPTDNPIDKPIDDEKCISISKSYYCVMR